MSTNRHYFVENRCPDDYILSYASIPVSNFPDEFVCCRFSIHKQQENICAFGSEHGNVLLCDAAAPIKGSDFVKARFKGGNSAVFDLCFIPERPDLLLSLCGGSRLELWDIERSSSVLLHGHHDTVRCASIWPENPFCVLTGSRDGAILLWDLREKPLINGICRKKLQNSLSVRQFESAHGSVPITGILHMGSNYFLSSSSSSSSGIRIWDLRYQIVSSPIRTLFVPQKMNKESGVASICWDRFRSSFFALCTDSAIYEYVPALNSAFPVRSFRAEFVNSFFVQCAASPFSDHLLCGSSLSKAFIWDLQENRKYFQDVNFHFEKKSLKKSPTSLPYAKFVLEGHEREVEWVQWSSNGQFMVTLDSEIIRIWSRWTSRSEHGYPEEVVVDHRPLKFTYPKVQIGSETEVTSSSQTLSQQTFGSEQRSESRCSEENDIQLLVDSSPNRRVFNALDNLPALYSKSVEGTLSATVWKDDRRPKRTIVIKSNLKNTPASKIPRVDGHDHLTPIPHTTPKGRGRNLTVQFQRSAEATRKRHCVVATSPAGRKPSKSCGSAKKQMLLEKSDVKQSNSMNILHYFARVQENDNRIVSSPPE